MKGVPVELSFSQPSRLVVYCDEHIGVQYENGWLPDRTGSKWTQFILSL